MEWSRLTDPESVRRALNEFDDIGREQFLAKYGYGEALSHYLRTGGKYYDSKAIAGVAYGYQYPDEGPPASDQFNNVDAARRRLEILGFAITDAPPRDQHELRDRLSALKAYQRDDRAAPHKPLVLVLALRRFAEVGTSSTGVHELGVQVGELLAALGERPDGALEPIWRLQFDGLAEITDNGQHLIDKYPAREHPGKLVLDGIGVTWSLPAEVHQALDEHPDLIDEIEELVLGRLTGQQRKAVEEWFGDSRAADGIGSDSQVRRWGLENRSWLIRAYRTKENADYCLNNSVACISFREIPDMAPADSRDDLQQLVDEHLADRTPAARRNFVTQLDRFRHQVSPGDIVVLPHLDGNGGRLYAIGTCTSGYRFDHAQPPDSELKHQLGIDWHIKGVSPEQFGSLAVFLNAPLTVQPLDDDLTQRLENLIQHGTVNLTWWVNQGHSFDFEIASACICAPRKTTRGHVLRYWADVGRVLRGDTVIHYSKGYIVAVSRALNDGEEGIRPYGPDGDMDGWQPEVYIARCSYETLWDEIPLDEVQGRTPDIGPFSTSGGVKQGYLWPVRHDFIAQLIDDHADRLRGTILNPGNVWIFQANPNAEHTRFPQRLEEVAGTDEASQWDTTWSVTRYANEMQPGDRVMFWFSGKAAGIYGSGLIWHAPDEAEADPITGSRTRVDIWVNMNHANRPVLKDALREDPELNDLSILQVPNGTNFRATRTNWDAYINRVATVPSQTRNNDDEESAMTLTDLATRLHLSPPTALEPIVELLHDRPQTIFYGPPGTGKTYIARELAQHLTAGGGETKLVQFHPSYSYEDFVEGWRPTVDNGFELKDGAFKSFVERANARPEQRFVMVIDEINRANLSKVLGELFFLLEYRTDTVTLQYSDQPFSIPANLWIIGTMNTADRSIAMIDAALRRRFHFHPFFPSSPPIGGVLKRFLQDTHPELAWVADMIDRVNDMLPDPNLGIGHSHFMREHLNEQLIERIWTHSIIPYLEDTFDLDHEQLRPYSFHTIRQQ